MSTFSPQCVFTGNLARPGRRESARFTAVRILPRRITLGEFLKWAGVAPTGGQAKVLVQGGEVFVNGVAEHRRGRKLEPGDRVAVGGREYRVVAG